MTSLATLMFATLKGARIVQVHDLWPAVETIAVAVTIRAESE
jgi:dihydropteroate synthase